MDIQLCLKTIEHIVEVHVVSVKNECKELLLLLDFTSKNEPKVHAVNIQPTETETYTFTYSEKYEAESTYGEISTFLYEPNASILKAGAFNKVGKDFGLMKLNPNTHLFTSDTLRDQWPGRVFEIIHPAVDKSTLKTFAPSGSINVITRNYPISTTELKKKFRLRDGGDYFLIGFRDIDGSPRLIVA